MLSNGTVYIYKCVSDWENLERRHLVLYLFLNNFKLKCKWHDIFFFSFAIKQTKIVKNYYTLVATAYVDYKMKINKATNTINLASYALTTNFFSTIKRFANDIYIDKMSIQAIYHLYFEYRITNDSYYVSTVKVPFNATTCANPRLNCVRILCVCESKCACFFGYFLCRSLNFVWSLIVVERYFISYNFTFS